MTLVTGMQHRLQRSQHGKGMLLKPGFNHLQGALLIPFHREYIVGVLVENRLSDGFLAASSVDGDQPTGERQTREQTRNAGNLVGFAVPLPALTPAGAHWPMHSPDAAAIDPVCGQTNAEPSFHRWPRVRLE